MLPIALKAAKAWRAKGRYGRMIARAPEPGRTLMDCIQREEQSPDHIKIINSGLNSITEFGKETSSQFSLDELTSAADAARSRRQKIMVHANGRLPVENALTARCDSIEHGFFMGRDNMQKMAELQITWIPTEFSMKAFSTLMPPESVEVQVAARNLEHQINQIETARTLGVPIAVGTDAGGYGLRHGASFSDELELFMAGGFTIEETIRCATFEGARLLGLHHELGRLAKGMPASFVAIGGPPSALPGALKHVKTVYIRGKRVI